METDTISGFNKSAIVRTASAVVVLGAALAAFATPVQAAPRIFEALNRTTGYTELVYKRYPSGNVLLHVNIPPGKGQALDVPENTQIYVWIDRTGCAAWSELAPSTGPRTFYVLPNCKIEVTSSRPT